MENQIGFESSNLNQKWLLNVLENLKNLERQERLARNGVENLEVFAMMPPKARAIEIPNAHYENLKHMITELDLLATDLGPLLKKDQKFYKSIKESIATFMKIIYDRSAFVIDIVDNNQGRITQSILSDLFYQTLNSVSDIRALIINQIAPILYVEEDDNPMKKQASLPPITV